MAGLQGRERLHHRRVTAQPDTSRSSRPSARFALAALILGWAVLGARPALAQDDDWSVVSDQVQSPRVQSPQESQPAADGARMICGEMARPASEPYKSIVANIDRECGSDAQVYESVRADSPHVSRGGCIFYNPAFMAVFLRGETDEHGEPDKTSMIYAIMAHELGHIVHHDYRRTGVSSVTKELEADHFSGYTLERLGIARDNITPFYSLGGDEFSGVHDHGFSNQRIAAFDQGWKAAEWNRAEGDKSAIESAGKNAAADGSDESDDSSAASAVP